MSNIVLIHYHRDGMIGLSHEWRNDRPTYPKEVAGKDYWWLTDKVHESINSNYALLYRDPYWQVIIEDPDDALLFKLTWG